jgi:hypothetical protein
MLLRLFRTSSPCASTETPKFWKQYRFMCLYSLKFSRCREETERWAELQSNVKFHKLVRGGQDRECQAATVRE